jgi:hypothetical protein
MGSSDWKGSADIDTMTASVMTLYARICAALDVPAAWWGHDRPRRGDDLQRR